jgi:hypothetical protein
MARLLEKNCSKPSISRSAPDREDSAARV